MLMTSYACVQLFIILSLVSNNKKPLRDCCTIFVARLSCNTSVAQHVVSIMRGKILNLKMAYVNKQFLWSQLYIILVVIARRRKRKNIIVKRSHRFWVRRFLKKREEKGAFNSLIPELRMFDREYFYRYLRMSPERLEHLLTLVGPLIIKKVLP